MKIISVVRLYFRWWGGSWWSKGGWLALLAWEGLVVEEREFIFSKWVLFLKRYN